MIFTVWLFPLASILPQSSSAFVVVLVLGLFPLNFVPAGPTRSSLVDLEPSANGCSAKRRRA